MIAAFALITLGAWAWHIHLRQEDSALQIGPSDLWVDGFTDDLITDLGTAGDLQVISRSSVMAFKTTHAPLPDIARELHVTLTLEGTVVHRNGHVRITTQLLDARHDHQIWAASYSRKTDDILSLQDEIAANITTAITEKLTGNPRRPASINAQ